jgi:5-methylcytosine-specific restriction protein A
MPSPRSKIAVARDWKQRRMTCKNRAHGRCQGAGCGARIGDHGFADHIICRAEGGTDDLSNLQWLCESCHDKKTKAEIARGNRRRADRGRFTTQGSHPGILA